MRTLKSSFFSIALLLFLSSAVWPQKAEVTVSLGEPFFDSLLDAIFQNFGPPQFQIAEKDGSVTRPNAGGPGVGTQCSETVRILREMNGVRTAVRFRDGKVLVPLAFSGSYDPPFVGCVEFAGWAESQLDLEFDKENQRLVGRVQVLNVNLNGTGGVGGTLIAKLLQTSIDKKLNPIEIFKLDKLSLSVPVQNSGNLMVRAVGARPEVVNGAVVLHIDYQFSKG